MGAEIFQSKEDHQEEQLIEFIRTNIKTASKNKVESARRVEQTRNADDMAILRRFENYEKRFNNLKLHWDKRHEKSFSAKAFERDYFVFVEFLTKKDTFAASLHKKTHAPVGNSFMQKILPQREANKFFFHAAFLFLNTTNHLQNYFYKGYNMCGGRDFNVLPPQNSSWKRYNFAVHDMRILAYSRVFKPSKVSYTVLTEGNRARVVTDVTFGIDQHKENIYEFICLSVKLPEKASPYALSNFTFQNEKSKVSVEELTDFPFVEVEEKQTKIKDWDEFNYLSVKHEVEEKIYAEFKYPSEFYHEAEKWTNGNLHKFQVFELENVWHINQAVRFAYEIDIENDEFILPIPKDFETENVSIVVKNNQKQSIMLSTEPTKKEISGYKTTYTFNKPTSDIKINFGNEKHAYFDKEGFFAADFSPEIPLIKRNLPSHFDIALDISTSSESDFLIWERAALEILEQNEAQIQTFSLIFFNIGTDFDLSKRMINNAENRIKLRKILKKIKFFGGSDLSNLFKSISKLKNKTEVEDGLLLFTNGFSSWGDDNIFLSIRQNKAYRQIFTFYSADNAKIAVLEKIAAENRGTNFYVKNVKTCQAAGRNIGYEAFSVVLPKITSGEILVYDCKRSVYAGEKVRIVGRIASLSDNYELEIQFKNNDKTLMTAAKLKKTDYQTLPRLFGLAVNEHLRIEEVKYKNLIIENAEAHAIVGKYTFFYFDKDNFFGEKRKSKRIETANLVNRINHFEMKSEKDAFKNWLHQVIYSKYQNVKSFDKLQNSFRKMPDSAFVIKHKPKKIISQASSEFKKLTHHQALPNPLGYSFENYEKSARLFEEAQKKHSKLQWLSGLSWFLEKDNNDFGNLTFAVRECLKIGEFHDAWHLSVRLMTLYPNDAVCYELAIEAAKGMKNAPLAEAVDSLRNNLLSLKKQ